MVTDEMVERVKADLYRLSCGDFDATPGEARAIIASVQAALGGQPQARTAEDRERDKAAMAAVSMAGLGLAAQPQAEPVAWLEAQPLATLTDALRGFAVSTRWHIGPERPTPTQTCNEMWPLYAAAQPPAPPGPSDWRYRVVTWDTTRDAAFDTHEAARRYIQEHQPESTEWHIERTDKPPVWTLITPAGRCFYGDTSLKAAKAEIDSRITPERQLANIRAAMAEEACAQPWMRQLMSAVEQILDDGHLHTDTLAQLRAAHAAIPPDAPR